MTFAPIMRKALLYGAVFAGVLAILGSILGYLAAGLPGLVSALLGALLTVIFMGFTAGSILVAGRATRGDSTSPVFYGIVLGVWMLKLVVFVIVVILLRTQPFLSPAVFGVSILVAVIGSLAIDIVAYLRARVPYTDSVLPGQSKPPTA